MLLYFLLFFVLFFACLHCVFKIICVLLFTLYTFTDSYFFILQIIVEQRTLTIRLMLTCLRYGCAKAPAISWLHMKPFGSWMERVLCVCVWYVGGCMDAMLGFLCMFVHNGEDERVIFVFFFVGLILITNY